MATVSTVPATVPEPVETDMSIEEFELTFGMTVPAMLDFPDTQKDFLDTEREFLPSAFDDSIFLD